MKVIRFFFPPNLRGILQQCIALNFPWSLHCSCIQINNTLHLQEFMSLSAQNSGHSGLPHWRWALHISLDFFITPGGVGSGSERKTEVVVILCQPFFAPNLKNNKIFLRNGKMLPSLWNFWNAIAPGQQEQGLGFSWTGFSLWALSQETKR